MTTEATIIEREVRIEARPEIVFAYLTDAEKMIEWEGVEATLDPRPGGVYRCNMNGNDIMLGEFVEAVPHSRVVFTVGWEGEGHPIPPGSTTVEITLTPDGDGTLLRLVHRDLSADAVEGHAEGWTHYLARLVIVAAGGDPGRDSYLDGD